MWKIILAELNYNKHLSSNKYFNGLFIFSLFGVIISIGASNEFNMSAVFVVFISLNLISIKFVKEKRERFYLALPVSAVRLAGTRIGFILIPVIVIISLILLAQWIVTTELLVKNALLISLMGLYILGYILFYLFRDILSGRYTAKNLKPGIVIVVFGMLTLALLVLLLQTRAAYNSPSPPLFLRAIDNFFSFLNSYPGVITVYGSILISAIASIFSYIKRKQYI